MQCFVPFYSSYHLDGYKRAACFSLIVFLMSCGFECSVSFLMVPLIGLQCVVVVFPDHTHLPFEANISPLVNVKHFYLLLLQLFS